MKEKIKNLFFYSGLEPWQYKKIENTRNEENRQILVIVSPVAGLIFLGLVIGAFFSDTMWGRLWMYSIGLAAEIFILLTSRGPAKKMPFLTVPMIHCYNMLLYVFGFVMDLLSRPDLPSVSFVVMVVICQLIFNIRPIQTGAMSLVAAITFLAIGYNIKGPVPFLDDILNVSCFWAAGFALNLMLSSVRASQHWGNYEISLRKEEIAAALKMADDANKAKTSFLFNMSHDIRTPMNAIMGYTALLDNSLENDMARQKNYLNKIKVSSKYMLDLLDNILEMSRIESGRTQLELEAQDICSFTDNLNVIFAEDMKRKDLSYSCEYKVTHKAVYIDPVKLRQIALNILGNSVKYTKNGGSIHLKLVEEPSGLPEYGKYTLTISDTGIGISEEFLPHLFESFSRERNTAQSNIVGSGLGMGIVKKLVDLMNGEISVESTVDVGTTISVGIRLKYADESEIPESGNSALQTNGSRFIKNIRILLAEDNDMNAEISIELLSQAGINVDRAGDGIECLHMLEAAEDDYYDLILMDIQMPIMNGFEATKNIRSMENSAKASLPIYAMTANAFNEDKQNALESGFSGYITKPVDIDVLYNSIFNAI